MRVFADCSSVYHPISDPDSAHLKSGGQLEYVLDRIDRGGQPFHEPTWMEHTREANRLTSDMVDWNHCPSGDDEVGRHMNSQNHNHNHNHNHNKRGYKHIHAHTSTFPRIHI